MDDNTPVPSFLRASSSTAIMSEAQGRCAGLPCQAPSRSCATLEGIAFLWPKDTFWPRDIAPVERIECRGGRRVWRDASSATVRPSRLLKGRTPWKKTHTLSAACNATEFVILEVG